MKQFDVIIWDINHSNHGLSCIKHHKQYEKEKDEHTEEKETYLKGYAFLDVDSD